MPNGSCFCGELKYSYGGEPMAQALCHCRDCQKLSGSAYSTNVVAPADHFKILAGKPKEYTSEAASKNKITNFFCGNCGVTLWREGPAFPGGKIIKIGTVDDLNDLHAAKPALELFAKDRVQWLQPMEGLAQAEAMPGK